MASEFDPVPPPLVLPPVPDILSPNVPLNPPMVGFASPFQHVDSENRDIILESIRTWIWRNLLPWTESWQTQLTTWETAEEDQLNAWMLLADAYITAHAISGYSFRVTATPIAGSGTTNVVFTGVDQAFRPVVVGDLVLDESIDGNFGIVTAIIDPTHATVAFVGSLRGPQGVSWRNTATDIAGSGTTNIVLAGPFYLGDFAITTQADGNWGVITALIDSTHATVTFAGSLRGPQGAQGVAGVVQEIVAGANVTVDNTDPTHPVVASTGGGGGSSATLGLYSARPAIGTVADGAIYIARDVGESYIAQGGFWVQYGGGSQLAYAQTEDSSLVSAPNSTDVFIPGLSATFVAGESPVMVDYLLRLSASTTDTVTKCSVYLEQGTTGANLIAATEFAAGAPASTWHSFLAECQLYGLQPGETYTVTIAIHSEGPGTAYFAADIPTPCFVRTTGL